MWWLRKQDKFERGKPALLLVALSICDAPSMFVGSVTANPSRLEETLDLGNADVSHIVEIPVKGVLVCTTCAYAV